MPSGPQIPPIASIVLGDSPIVAFAVHDGHAVRPELESLFALDPQERLREEDPFTGEWTAIAPSRIIGARSRFEVDLNRPREKAVYRTPGDAWGLHVWQRELPADVIATSLAAYDSFYAIARALLAHLVERYRQVFVFDLHSYNHRREGPECAGADAEGHPEVNIGTGTLDRKRWGPLVDRFMHDLSSFDFAGRQLDVRENVCFQGGNLSRWIHEEFGGDICSLAIEFKKFFMDEWTATPDRRQLTLITRALESTIPGVHQELRTRHYG